MSSRQTLVKHFEALGIRIRAEDRRLGPARYGEKKVKGRHIIHKRQNEIIQKIQSMRAKNMSYENIAKALNSMNVPAMKKGAQWHGMSVYRAINNGLRRTKV